jgi:hypothetical protein
MVFPAGITTKKRTKKSSDARRSLTIAIIVIVSMYLAIKDLQQEHHALDLS